MTDICQEVFKTGKSSQPLSQTSPVTNTVNRKIGLTCQISSFYSANNAIKFSLSKLSAKEYMQNATLNSTLA